MNGFQAKVYLAIAQAAQAQVGVFTAQLLLQGADSSFKEDNVSRAPDGRFAPKSGGGGGGSSDGGANGGKKTMDSAESVTKGLTTTTVTVAHRLSDDAGKLNSSQQERAIGALDSETHKKVESYTEDAMRGISDKTLSAYVDTKRAIDGMKKNAGKLSDFFNNVARQVQDTIATATENPELVALGAASAAASVMGTVAFATQMMLAPADTDQEVFEKRQADTIASIEGGKLGLSYALHEFQRQKQIKQLQKQLDEMQSEAGKDKDYQAFLKKHAKQVKYARAETLNHLSHPSGDTEVKVHSVTIGDGS